MNKKIIFSTGGTGGHIFPALNLMKHFFEKGHEVLLVTDSRGDEFIRNYQDFKSYVLKVETPTNKNLFKKFIALMKIFYSVIRSIFILWKEKPNLVFGMGGYVSFPISIAAKFFNLPLVIYENNMILGRANKYLAPFSKKILVAKKIAINFSKKYENKTFEVGTILSKEIINYPTIERKSNKNFFTILVLGGSQGAEIFGEIIPQVVQKIKNNKFEVQILQQCVEKQIVKLKDFYNKNNIKNKVFRFEKNVANLIFSSDIAITRSGASTMAELEYIHTPFVAIPLPDSVDNHQYFNAKYYENRGCCWIINQENFNIENLFNLIISVIQNKNKLEEIRENMKKNHKKNVYNNIEIEIKELV